MTYRSRDEGDEEDSMNEDEEGEPELDVLDEIIVRGTTEEEAEDDIQIADGGEDDAATDRGHDGNLPLEMDEEMGHDPETKRKESPLGEDPLSSPVSELGDLPEPAIVEESSTIPTNQKLKFFIGKKRKLNEQDEAAYEVMTGESVVKEDVEVPEDAITEEDIPAERDEEAELGMAKPMPRKKRKWLKKGQSE
jgi:hypothetical protein